MFHDIFIGCYTFDKVFFLLGEISIPAKKHSTMLRMSCECLTMIYRKQRGSLDWKHFEKPITDEANDAERKIGSHSFIQTSWWCQIFVLFVFVLKLRALIIVALAVLKRYIEVQISVNTVLAYWHFCKIQGYFYVVLYLMLCWDLALFSVSEFYYEFRSSKFSWIFRGLIFISYLHAFQTFINSR